MKEEMSHTRMIYHRAHCGGGYSLLSFRPRTDFRGDADPGEKDPLGIDCEACVRERYRMS